MQKWFVKNGENAQNTISEPLNREFTQKDINPHISHAEQYYRYVMKLLGHNWTNADKNHFTR